ncbi:MAG: hypothetical protein QOC63_1319, partial [Mycobacterium sp.]|nr:hypothetical protein [Mycobacterium sp.]
PRCPRYQAANSSADNAELGGGNTLKRMIKAIPVSEANTQYHQMSIRCVVTDFTNRTS